MSTKLKVLAILNLIGWAIVVPVLVSNLVSPLLDYNSSPDTVGSGQAGTTQLAPLAPRPSGGTIVPSSVRPAGRSTGEQVPTPLVTRVLRQNGVPTPVRTGPLLDGIPSNTIVQIKPRPGATPDVGVVTIGVTDGSTPNLPDAPGPDTGTGGPVTIPTPAAGNTDSLLNPVTPSSGTSSPSTDAGIVAEGPPLLGAIIVSEPIDQRPVVIPQAPPVATPTPTATGTATPAPTQTATPVPTETATPVPTSTATPVPTGTATTVPTDTATPAPSDTATAAPTETATAAPTDTATPAPTETATEAPTETPTYAPTDTPTAAPTDTATPEPTATATPVATSTPAPPQAPGPDDPPDQHNRKVPPPVADRPKATVESKDDAPDDE